MKARKSLAAAAVLAAGALVLTACSSGGSGSGSTASSAGGGKVTMTFWHNSTTGDGKAYWESTVKDFETANPNVTINIQAIQNEDMDGKLQTALNSGDAPDIFMARGGGKLADVVALMRPYDGEITVRVLDKMINSSKAPNVPALLEGPKPVSWGPLFS